MKTRELMYGIAVVMFFYFGWLLLVKYLDKQHPEWNLLNPPAATQPATPATPAPGTLPAPTGVAPTTTIGAAPTTAPALLPVISTDLAKSVDLGSDAKDDPTYALKLSLSPRGAGIAAVTLNDFKQVVTSNNRYMFQKPVEGFEDDTRPLATQTVTVNGQSVDLSKVDWNLTDHTLSRATYSVPIGALVQVYKTYEISERNGEPKGSGGYEVRVHYGFKNLSPNAVTVKTSFNGVAVPPRELDNGPDLQVLTAYNDKSYLELTHDMVEAYSKDRPSRELLKSDKGNPLLWIGANSVYFNAIVRPTSIEAQNVTPNYLSSVKVTALNPDSKPEDRHLAMKIETTELTLAAGQTTELPLRVFFGPRKRDLLNNEYYAAFPRNYDRSLVLTSGPCGYCTFQWLINILVGMLVSFHWVFGGFIGHGQYGDWGLAIITLVLLVRLALHPVTKKSQVNMMKMGKMGPEAERLKKKYADNKDELNKALMQLYKEQGFTPVLGCLPMFLQMPIWIALWSSLQSTFELRHSPFLHFGALKLSWINDLAKPDHLLTWQPITLPFGFQLGALNLLPLLLAVVFFLQQKYTPKPPATSPEQEQQQKMMQWMSLLFPIFLYNGPSGLNLYILTSTSLGIIESKVIRKHIKEREEAEKNGKVIVDASPGRRTKRVESKEVGVKKGGVMGWIEDLQRRAEDVRKQQDKK